MTKPALSPADQARLLIRGSPTATLATLAVDGRAGPGAPYASLVLTACRQDATPILLLSRLAEHTKNLLRDSRVSLLFDGTAGLESPLTGPRLTVQGPILPCDADRAEARARFLARHPDAAVYADFADFGFYRVEARAAHLVAGFGRILWIDGPEMRFGESGDDFLAAEPEVVEHMNGDHSAAVDRLARGAGKTGSGWRMTGCDAEGCDLRRGAVSLRVAFDPPLPHPRQIRDAMIALVNKAGPPGAS